ncbi:Hypothetical_protein [Hexamita inflata]|uniref:Hypothetical_protein n=1 Tax=Hexamita inflata TaxID=28002 RepID=A0AA86RIR7_9EUKA|nr:Hypothetical protein HINF_LOCUS64977 [Hexamita inflata]
MCTPKQFVFLFPKCGYNQQCSTYRPKQKRNTAVINFMMLFSSILFKSLTFTQPKASCASKLSADGKEYQFCHKAKELSSYTLGQTLNLNNAGSSVFLYTEAVQRSNLTVQFSQATTFAVFGLQVESQKITGTTINVTIDFSIVTGALVCLQCNLSVDSSTLVFSASGQKLSGIMTTAGLFFQVSKSLLQFRLNGIYQSGLVNSIQREMTAFALQDSRMTCYFYNDGDQTGNLAVEVGAKTVLLASGFSICSNGIKDVAFASDPAFWTVSGSIGQNCITICESGFVTYGLCLMDLLNGVQSNGQASCQNNFKFDGKDCVCEAGYVLNGTVCVNLVGFLSETGQNITNINDIIDSNILVLNNTINKEVSKAEQNIANNKSNLLTQIQINEQNLTARILQMKLNGEKTISDFIASLEANLQQNISTLQDKVVSDNIALNKQITDANTTFLETISSNEQLIDAHIKRNMTFIENMLPPMQNTVNNSIYSVNYLNKVQIDDNEDSTTTEINRLNCYYGDCKIYQGTIRGAGYCYGGSYNGTYSGTTDYCTSSTYSVLKPGSCKSFLNTSNSNNVKQNIYNYMLYCCKPQGYWDKYSKTCVRNLS